MEEGGVVAWGIVPADQRVFVQETVESLTERFLAIRTTCADLMDVEVFDRLAMPILLETLGHPAGFYVSQVGPLNQFVHLWAYEDLADYERRCRARDTHPAFPAYLSASEHLIVAQETRLIRAVDLPTRPHRSP